VISGGFNLLKKFLFILSLLILFVIAGCGSVETKSSGDLDNQLVYASESEFAGLNPILQETNTDALLFRGLMRFDEENKPALDIAESYQVSTDELTYSFKLREDIKFHDGTRLTADDVIFTIESILDDSNASFLKSDFTAVESMKKQDDFNLEIRLKYPFAPFMDKMTVPILPHHLLEGTDIRNNEYNVHPVGTGPYKFDQWNHGNNLTLVANEDFHGTKPSIEKVIFKFIPDSNNRALQLKSGEVDIALLDPVQAENIEDADNLSIHAIETADYRGILYNMKNNLWKDVNVRKAFNYAIDRKKIVDGILRGYGIEAYSPLQKHNYANENVEQYTYDIDKAKTLLDKAGWKEAEDGWRYKNGMKLEFTLTTPASDMVRVNIANYAAESFKAIGAEVKVEALDWNAIKIEDTDAFIIAWGSPYDADHHTHILFHSEQSSTSSSGYNYGDYSNNTVDKLLEKGRITTGNTERKAIYSELQEELSNDPPYNFVAYVDAIYGINSNLEGIKERTLGHHGSGFLWNVEEWKWNDR
jgi:peptide/nickel transport system substrate-binding protein